MDRLPYTADQAIIRDHSHTVDAVWVSFPDIADQLRTGDIETYDRLMLNPRVEIEPIGNLRRVYKRDGHTLSGWLLHTSSGQTDYVGPRKTDALAALRQAITDYFNRS